MTEMKELINEKAVLSFINYFAIFAPLAGILFGLLVGKITKKLRTGFIYGFIIGLSGPLILILWKIYNGITNYYGLDSLKGLLINLVVFVLMGMLLGLIFSFALRKSKREGN